MPAPYQISDSAAQYTANRKVSGIIDYQYTQQLRDYVKAASVMDQLIGGQKQVLVPQGRGRAFAVVDGMQAGYGYRPNTMAPIAPTSRAVDPVWATVDTTNFYGSISIFNKDYIRLRNTPDSITQTLASVDGQIKRLRTSMVHDHNCSFFGDGTAVIAKVKTDVTSATVAMKHWTGADVGSTTYAVKKGLSVAFIRPTTGAVVWLDYVTTASFEDGTCTLSTNPGAGVIAANDYIVIGDVNGNSYGLACGGLYSMFNASTSYLGVTLANLPEWVPQVHANPAGAGTPRPYNPDLIVQAYLLAKSNAIGDGPDFLLSSNNEFMEHYKNYDANVQRSVFETDMGLEIDLPMFNLVGKPIPWRVEELAVPGHIIGLSTESWERVVDDEGSWQKGDNGAILRYFERADAYYGLFYRYVNMYCAEPRANFLIKDIEISTPGTVMNK